MSRHLNQIGDTIVEVLVCIAIVSLILAGAYATTNRSSIGVRDSQEHAEALKLVQSQLEQIRTNATQPSPTVFSQATPFCMYNTAAISATQPPQNANCTQGSGGQPTTNEPAYQLSVQRADTGNGGFLFTVQAQWDSVTGHGKALEQIVYRLYQ